MDLISFEQIATKGLSCVLEMAQWGKGIYCKLDIVQSHAVEGEDQHHKLSSDFFPDTLVLKHAYTTLTHIHTGTQMHVRTCKHTLHTHMHIYAKCIQILERKVLAQLTSE